MWWLSWLGLRGLYHVYIPVYRTMWGCINTIKIYKPICSPRPFHQTKLNEDCNNFSVVHGTHVDSGAVQGAEGDEVLLIEGTQESWRGLLEMLPLSTWHAVWAVSQSVVSLIRFAGDFPSPQLYHNARFAGAGGIAVSAMPGFGQVPCCATGAVS